MRAAGSGANTPVRRLEIENGPLEIISPPRAAATGRTRDQTLRPALLTHIGWRACATSISPQASTPRWNRIHTGRSAAAAFLFAQRGFKVWLLDGGLKGVLEKPEIR